MEDEKETNGCFEGETTFTCFTLQAENER